MINLRFQWYCETCGTAFSAPQDATLCEKGHKVKERERMDKDLERIAEEEK